MKQILFLVIAALAPSLSQAQQYHGAISETFHQLEVNEQNRQSAKEEASRLSYNNIRDCQELLSQNYAVSQIVKDKLRPVLVQAAFSELARHHVSLDPSGYSHPIYQKEVESFVKSPQWFDLFDIYGRSSTVAIYVRGTQSSLIRSVPIFDNGNVLRGCSLQLVDAHIEKARSNGQVIFAKDIPLPNLDLVTVEVNQ
jgi:hypothetical protein